MDIAIWGCNAFSEYLYGLLDQSSVNVIAFIEGYTDSITFCGKPLYSAEAFKSNKELSAIPIVIASPHNLAGASPCVDLESMRQFKIHLQLVASKYTITNPLLHPAALVDILKVRYDNKVVTIGVQGSGNTLFTHIIQKIQVLNTTKAPIAYFFEQLCYEYAQIIFQVVGDALFSAGSEDIHIAPWKIGATHLTCFMNGERSGIFCFQTRDHITHSNFGYHTFPTQDTVKHLQSLGMKIFSVNRNPLDIILSILNKNKMIDHQSGQIKNDGSVFVICDLQIELLRQWNPIRKMIKELRYEGLLRNPVNYIAMIMTELGLSPDVEFASKIWDELKFKQLPAATSNHFWNGGAGKWESYFTKEHLIHLKAINAEEVIDLYGYPDVLQKFRQLTRDFTKDDLSKYYNDGYSSSYFVRDYIDNKFGFDTSDLLKFVHHYYGDDSTSRSLDHLVIGSKNREDVRRIEQVLNNKFIEVLIKSGSHPAYRIC
jgi:hypothetical protein